MKPPKNKLTQTLKLAGDLYRRNTIKGTPTKHKISWEDALKKSAKDTGYKGKLPTKKR